MEIISAGNMIDCIALNKSPKSFQKVENKTISLCDYSDFFSGKSISWKTKMLLNSTGLSNKNTIIRQVIHLLEISIFLIKNKGLFLLGEQGTGKSTLFTRYFQELFKKAPEVLSTALLIGNGNISSEKKMGEITPLLQEVAVLVEEFINGAEQSDSSVIGTLKDALDSKEFLMCKKVPTPTETTFVFAGNSYEIPSSKEDLTRVTKVFPKNYKDRALADRLPFVLPHFKSLFGETYYVESDEEILPIVHLQQIFRYLRECECDTILVDIENKREIGVYNPFIHAISILLYPDSTAPEWFTRGWFEFFKFFRSILIAEKIYDPFNKNSARLIIEMLGYSIDEIEYVAFSSDRILIKSNTESKIDKVALTGFGINDNKLEYEFYKNKSLKEIAPILNCTKNYSALTQKISGDLPFEYRIYFDNIKEANAKRTDKKDDEYNSLVLEKIERYAKEDIPFSKEELTFRGIPEIYKILISGILDNIFHEKTEVDTLRDFSFNKNEIQIVNYSKFLKNI